MGTLSQPGLSAAPILGDFLRIVKLNSCGVPVTGASSAQIVTSGFIQVQDSPQYDTGDRKIQRLANGLICVNKKLPDVFTNDQLTIDFCVWCPDLISTVIGGRLITATTPTSGSGFFTGESATPVHASLEVWQEVSGPGACDPSSGLQQYVYHAWPHLSDFKRGQFNINNDPTQFQLLANSFASTPLWTAGNSWLGGNPIITDHYAMNITTTVPPTDTGCNIYTYP